MNDVIDSFNAVIPPKYQQFAILLGLVLKYGAEFYSSIVAGGGIKRIACSFIYGENVPKVIATDYKEELNTAKPKPPEA